VKWIHVVSHLKSKLEAMLKSKMPKYQNFTLINVFLDPKYVGVDTTPELISLLVSEILRKIHSKWRPFWNPRWRPKYQHFTL